MQQGQSYSADWQSAHMGTHNIFNIHLKCFVRVNLSLAAICQACI